MIVGPNYAYYPCPRTGSVYLCEALKTHFDGEERAPHDNHLTRNMAVARYGSVPEFGFTSIRNPLAWYPSWWALRQKTDAHLGLGFVVDKYKDKSFREFVEGEAGCVSILAERFVAGCDFVCVTEDLNGGLRTAMKMCGIDNLEDRMRGVEGNAKPLNASSLEHLDECVYTSELAQLIFDKDKLGYELWGRWQH